MPGKLETAELLQEVIETIFLKIDNDKRKNMDFDW
jgi:hypothetical protein